MDNLEIIVTADGSHTLRNKDLDETYHSIHGAVRESMHVFIRNGLEYYHKAHQVKEISVLEIGFGTGLNALLSLAYGREHEISIRYTTLEPFPLPRPVWSALNYNAGERSDFEALHEASWGSQQALTSGFTILKLKNSLQDIVFSEEFDLIFFDAFAPSVQPDLWMYELLEKVTDRFGARGVFVTYSAMGQLKRDLKSLGLDVETMPGPPGKRQMVRAVKVSTLG